MMIIIFYYNVSNSILSPQDTNHNLRMVDRMFEEYRDVGAQQSKAMERVRWIVLYYVFDYKVMKFSDL